MDGSEPACTRTRLAGVLLATLLATGPLQAAEPPLSLSDWKLDAIQLSNGRVLKGVLLGENPFEIRFQIIRQNPGQKTFVFNAFLFRTAEFQWVEKLKADERQRLMARLKALDPTGAGELARMNELELKPAAWRQDPKRGLSYSSEHFQLVSNAREDIVRRVAVRLEEIYAAYTTRLPPRARGKPTTILLADSLEEYQALLKDQGRNLLNLAFYDPSRNQIVAASPNLQSLGEGLEQARKEHEKYRQEFRDLEQLYRNKEMPESIASAIRDGRRRMDDADKYNEKIFHDATRELFQTLYHEAFHAYLGSFVYPSAEFDVPRWLNEGLAQIFETAIVEAGDLRVGHADAARLQRVKAGAAFRLKCLWTASAAPVGSLDQALLLDAARHKCEAVPLADLLVSGPKQFLVSHASDRAVSDRYYLTSWALAYYLTFDRRVLGTSQLEQYARDCKRGRPPLEAFRALVDQPLDAFESAFLDYLLQLRPDGTLSRRF